MYLYLYFAGGQLGGQQMFVSSAGQQPGQVVLTTVGGQHIQQPPPQVYTSTVYLLGLWQNIRGLDLSYLLLL